MFISQERPINQLESFEKPRILIVMKLELICTIILWPFPVCPSILGLEHSKFEFASLVQYLQKPVVFFFLSIGLIGLLQTCYGLFLLHCMHMEELHQN